MDSVNSWDGLLTIQQPVYDGGYPSVDTGRETIRLMRLRPADAFEDLIRIDLFTSDLSDSPEYDALSYVWGSEISDTKAIVNGRAMELTVNLDDALRHFRRPDTARVLWIDAVCINQRVTEERNHQVRMMGRIYSSALRVLVWLGSEAGDSAAVISAIQAGYDPQQLMSNLRFRFGLRRLCSRSWFSRIWVVQEIALARSDPIITCGSDELLWSKFVHFLLQVQPTIEQELNLPSYPYAKFESDWERMVDVAIQADKRTGTKAVLGIPELEQIALGYSSSMWLRDNLVSGTSASSIHVGYGSTGQYAHMIWSSGKVAIREAVLSLRNSILQIVDLETVRSTRPHSHIETQLYRTRNLRASDPRDKVYALLGVSRFNGEAIMPDYSLPIERVLAEAMKNIIMYRFEVGYPVFPMRPAASRIDSWPSWIPDLSASQAFQPRYHVDQLCPTMQGIKDLVSRIRNRIPLALFSPDYRTMTTIGVSLGTIVAVDELSATDWHDIPFELGRLRSKFGYYNIPPYVFCDALMVQNDQYRNLSGEEKQQASADFSRLWKLASNSGFGYSLSDDLNWVCEMMAHSLTNDRTIFITDSGKVGVSPCNGIREGDKLAGLFCMNFPVVLRRQDKTPSRQYRMICVTHVGCHEWGHDLPEGEINFPILSRSLGMRTFTIV